MPTDIQTTELKNKQKFDVLGSQDFTQEPDIQFNEPNFTPIPNAAGINSDFVTPPLSLTQPEKKAEDLTTRLQGLNEQLIGESAFRAETEQQKGITGLEQNAQDLSGRLKQLQAEALSIPLQLQQDAEGRGITAGGLRPIQASALRKNAIQALSTSALFEAAKGNLQLAQDQVDRAVAAKYDPIREEIAAKTKNLDLILKSPAYTIADKNRAQAQKDAQTNQLRRIEKEESKEKEIYSIANIASQYGADGQTLDRINKASTPEEALQIAANAGFAQNPKAKVDLENARLSGILTRQQIDKTAYEFDLLKKYGGLTPQQYAALLEKEQKEIEEAETEQEKNRLQAQALDGKVTLIGTILNSSAIDSVVGPTILARAPSSPLGAASRIAGSTVAGAVAGAGIGAFAGGVGAIPGALFGGVAGAIAGVGLAGQGSVDHFTGASDALIGQTEQFISKEFLQNLIDVKAQGGTFGALQKAEQDALTASATFIGQRRICSDGSRGTCGEGSSPVGYDMSEADFRREIESIQQLTKLAYERATGSSWTSDEQKTWDELEKSYNDSTFNPTF